MSRWPSRVVGLCAACSFLLVYSFRLNRQGSVPREEVGICDLFPKRATLRVLFLLILYQAQPSRGQLFVSRGREHFLFPSFCREEMLSEKKFSPRARCSLQAVGPAAPGWSEERARSAARRPRAPRACLPGRRQRSHP